MAHVEVPNTKIKAFGKPWKIASRNDDGDVVWEDEEETKPQMEDSTTHSLIRELLILLQGDQAIRTIQKSNDGMHSHKLWNQIERGQAENFLRLDEDQHRWLFSLLARDMPLSKEAKDQGVLQRNLAQHLYGFSDWILLDQLKSIDEREYNLDGSPKESSEDDSKSDEPKSVKKSKAAAESVTDG